MKVGQKEISKKVTSLQKGLGLAEVQHFLFKNE